MLRETQMWDNVPTVIALVEKIMARVVASVQAENGKNTCTTINSCLTLFQAKLLARIFLYYLTKYFIFLYLLLF